MNMTAAAGEVPFRKISGTGPAALSVLSGLRDRTGPALLKKPELL